jgi:hypothetical protein
MRQSTRTNRSAMRVSVFSLVLVLAVSGWSQTSRPAASTAQTVQTYDGKWWSKTNSDEHSGFLNGADDCLTWTAREEIWPKNQRGFGGTWLQMNNAITRFYAGHPGSQKLSVFEVWKRVIVQSHQKPTAKSKYAETWNNPHWYLDGFWWLDAAPDERQGFVEGYLWCMRTHVPGSQDTYSKSADYYVEKIDVFTRANSHSKADREKIASILRRYRDSHAAE